MRDTQTTGCRANAPAGVHGSVARIGSSGRHRTVRVQHGIARQWRTKSAAATAKREGRDGQAGGAGQASGRGGHNRSCASMPTLMHCDTNCTARTQSHASERSLDCDVCRVAAEPRLPSGPSRGSAGVPCSEEYIAARYPAQHGVPRRLREAAEVGGVAYDKQHARAKCNARGTPCKTASAHVPAIAAASGRTRSPCRGRGAGSHASTPAAESAQRSRPADRHRLPQWHAWRTLVLASDSSRVGKRARVAVAVAVVGDGGGRADGWEDGCGGATTSPATYAVATSSVVSLCPS